MKIIIETLLRMSATASVVVLAVLTARVFMRRLPKIYSYLLWAIVGIRLCVPVTFESRFSIFNLFAKTEAQIQTAVTVPSADTAVQGTADPYKLIGIVWLAGMVILVIYGIFAYYRLQHKLRVSFPMGDGVYGVEGLASPFVMGFLNPKIYVPLGLDKDTERYVLMHERTHLKRGDHLIKLFAFSLLCVHWFNPFCWLAFILMSRDMEMSCDEKVLGTGDISSDYSSALLSFAANKRFPAPGPLCFGEVSVKRRIRNILKWKKPALFITVISVILCVTVFVVCACDSVEKKTPEPVEDKTEEVEAELCDTSEMSANTSADTTTADTTTADTTTADTTAADTTMVDTTAAETTPTVTDPPETTGQRTVTEKASDTGNRSAETTATATEKAEDIWIDPDIKIPYFYSNETRGEPKEIDDSQWSDIYDDYQPYLDIELP